MQYLRLRLEKNQITFSGRFVLNILNNEGNKVDNSTIGAEHLILLNWPKM